MRPFTGSALFKSYGSPCAVFPPFTWPADSLELQMKDCHSFWSAFWYRQHKNTVLDEGRRHLGERRKERGEDLGEKGKGGKKACLLD